jgi:hypothetical protein
MNELPNLDAYDDLNRGELPMPEPSMDASVVPVIDDITTSARIDWTAAGIVEAKP